WPRLFEFRAYTPTRKLVTVRPDALVRLRTVSGQDVFEDSFFVEVDRSSEVIEIPIERACCYRDYYRSGGFAIKSGGSRSEFEQFPFVVLFICKSEERRNN